MPTGKESGDQPEVHDPALLAQARAMLDGCRSAREMADAVSAAVARNEEWRGKRCINLLAPEAPTSPAVRSLLAAEVGRDVVDFRLPYQTIYYSFDSGEPPAGSMPEQG